MGNNRCYVLPFCRGHIKTHCESHSDQIWGQVSETEVRACALLEEKHIFMFHFSTWQADGWSLRWVSGRNSWQIKTYWKWLEVLMSIWKKQHFFFFKGEKFKPYLTCRAELEAGNWTLTMPCREAESGSDSSPPEGICWAGRWWLQKHNRKVVQKQWEGEWDREWDEKKRQRCCFGTSVRASQVRSKTGPHTRRAGKEQRRR